MSDSKMGRHTCEMAGRGGGVGATGVRGPAKGDSRE